MFHTHQMNSTPEVATAITPGHWPRVHKCLSCEFRCTAAKLAEVKANPQRHKIIRKTMAQAKQIYGLDYGT